MIRTCLICGHGNGEDVSHCSSCNSPLGSSSNIGETTVGLQHQTVYGPGDLIDNRYRVISELGRGGMGIVYKVSDTSLGDMEFALKLIHPQLVANPQARKRFEDEVAVCLSLEHPAIIRVNHFESKAEFNYFTMKYLDGRTLAEHLREREGRLPPFSAPEVQTVLTPLLDGLAYAHQHTIHRDIKPDNIMIMGDFPDVEIKILDFGIAKTMSTSRFTQTAQSMGTPYYMAPEQLADAHTVDHRADLYAVGMVLYEMVTGEKAVGLFELPSELLGEPYLSIDAILKKTLFKSPDRRFGSAIELKKSLLQAFDELAEAEQKADGRKAREERRKAAAAAEEKRQAEAAAEAERRQEEDRRKEQARKQREEEQRLENLKRQQEEAAKKQAEAERFLQEQEARNKAQENTEQGNKKEKRSSPLGALLMAGVVLATGAGGYAYYTDYQERQETGQAAQRQAADRQRQMQEEKQQLAIEFERARLAAEQKIRKKDEKVKKDVEEPQPTAQPAAPPAAQPEQQQPDMLIATLTVLPEPADAQIRILNIKPKYEPGMELPPGKYHIEASLDGYLTASGWVDLQAGQRLNATITLDKALEPVEPSVKPAAQTAAAPSGSKTFTDPTSGMEFVLIPGGCFQMGSPPSEDGRYDDEGPVHEVCVDSFYMGKYEVTQGEYQRITGSNPAKFKSGSDYPVEQVSWNDAQSFISKVNSRSGKTYRLPTEAEWEFAARAGTTTAYSFGANFSTSRANYGSATRKVGSYAANPFGLYDMHGNVYEWCQDWYDRNYYSNSPRNNPTGPSSGSGHVFRGGSWSNLPWDLRAARRYRDAPTYRGSSLGFRLVLPVQR